MDEKHGGGTGGIVILALLAVPMLVAIVIFIIFILMGISMISDGSFLPGIMLTLIGSATLYGLYIVGKYILTI